MSIKFSDTQNENILYSLDLPPLKIVQHENKSLCTPKYSWLTAVESPYSVFRSDSVSTSALKSVELNFKSDETKCQSVH